MNKIERRRQNRIRRRYFLLSFSMSFLVLAFITTGLLSIDKLKGSAKAPSQAQEPNDFYLPAPEDALTVLFMGLDSRDAEAGTFLLVRFDPAGGRIPVVCFPPDTRVIHNQYEDTLAGAYRFGGYGLATRALSETYGITINRYVKMTKDAFRGIAQVIGSVQYELKFDLNYENLQLSKGIQLVDGGKALDIITYPAYKGGELARAEVAAELAAQIINEKLNIVNAPAIDSIFKTVINLVDTDISYKDFEERKKPAVFLSDAGYSPAASLPISGWYQEEGGVLALSEETEKLLRSTFS